MSNYFCIRAEGTVTLLGEGIAHNDFEAFPLLSTCTGQAHAIDLINVPHITIGDQAQTGVPNTIRHYSFGINVVNSNLEVFNTSLTGIGDGVGITLRGFQGVYTTSIHGLGKSSTSVPLITNYRQGIDAKNYNVTVNNSRLMIGFSNA